MIAACFLLATDGPDLERAVTGALREATLGVSRQCGLVQIKVGQSDATGSGWYETRASAQSREMDRHQMPRLRCVGCSLTVLPPKHATSQEGGQSPEPLAIQPYNGGGAQPRSGGAARGGRTAWRWVQSAGAERVVVPATYRGAPLVLQQGINPNQALLLNSLRRLLQVSPQMEQELKRWCAEPLGDSMLGADRQGAGAADHRRLHREAPDLGAQFAQLVKELRSEYFAAITLCAERLAAELSKSAATSVVQLLRRDGVFASTQQLSAAVSCTGARLSSVGTAWWWQV